MAGGYDLSFSASFDVSALAAAAQRNRRKQIQLLGSLERYASTKADVEFEVKIAGSLDAMNNFRKKYTRYLRRMAKVEAQSTQFRLSGPRTPIRTGQTRRSSAYDVSYTGSQRFRVEVTQGAARRGYHYIGPLHDSGKNVTGKKFWFLKASEEFNRNMQGHLNPNEAVMGTLT